MEIIELLTRHLFPHRANDTHGRQTVAQIQTIQRHVFRQIRVRFLARHGQLEGSRLAQLTVDQLFGRAAVVKGNDSALAEQFAAEIALENRDIRDAAFICLLAMFELESAKTDSPATRRIVEAIYWLKQFGEIPPSASEVDALTRITETLSPQSPSTWEH